MLRILRRHYARRTARIGVCMRDTWLNGLIADLEYLEEQEQPKEISKDAKPELPPPSRLTQSGSPLSIGGLPVAFPCSPRRLRQAGHEGMVWTVLLAPIAIRTHADNALTGAAVELPIAVAHSNPSGQRLDDGERYADAGLAVAVDLSTQGPVPFKSPGLPHSSGPCEKVGPTRRSVRPARPPPPMG
jgi:hypothetical protein